MKAKSSTKPSSSRRSAVKAPKTLAKRSTKQKIKWKIVGDKVMIPPGDYSVADLEAMIKRLQAAK